MCIEIIAGILRNLGHKKRERTRQESTLLYTPGALTWKVSVILRSGKVSFYLLAWNIVYTPEHVHVYICCSLSPFLKSMTHKFNASWPWDQISSLSLMLIAR